MPKALLVIHIMTLEWHLNFDALVDLLPNLDDLRAILELTWVRYLRLVLLLLFDQPKLGETIWYDPRENLTKVLIKLQEVLFKGLLFLLIKIL